MGDRDLADLVRRRLFELGVTAAEVSRRSRGDVPAETVRGLARGQRFHRVGDRFARALARALEVTEYRVRRAAGLPVPDIPGEPTRPHLRVIRGGAQMGGEQPPCAGRQVAAEGRGRCGFAGEQRGHGDRHRLRIRSSPRGASEGRRRARRLDIATRFIEALDADASAPGDDPDLLPVRPAHVVAAVLGVDGVGLNRCTPASGV